MRFNRTGKKNRVSYRIVLQEHTTAPGKRHIEILGSYDPHSKNAVLKSERIQHWLKEGVQTSDAVHNLLAGQGLIQGEKRAKKIPRPVVKEAESAEPTVTEEVTPEPEANAEEEAPTEEVTTETEPEVVVEPETAEVPEEAETKA